MEQIKTSLRILGRQLLVCWLLAFIFYYLADALLDARIFGDASLAEQLLHPDLHELCIRLLSAFFQGIVLVYAWRLFKTRKRAETRLVEINRQLQQANRELESFNHTLAHDLRTPLTGLVTACGLLQELPETAAAKPRRSFCLDSIDECCQRMERTISGLLKLADLGRHQLIRQPVDLSRLAAMSLKALTEAHPTRPVAADITPDLAADADPEMVAILFDNLIGNAWKFAAGQPTLQLSVGSLRQRHRQVFFVRDNGVGFDLQQAKDLFQPFVRLHDHRQYPGQGIGLATVKRIVDRHGGELWAESAPGQGSRFYFTLQAD